MNATRKLFLYGVFLLLSFSSHAQNGACCRAAYFDVDTAPDPPVFKGIGDLHWPIVTHSDSCQMFFDQGICQNHCFNDFEANRAFRKALKLDSACAMCYWGLAMSTGNKDFDRKDTKDKIDKALSINEVHRADSFYEFQKVIIQASARWLLDKNERRGLKQFHKILGTMPDRYKSNIEYLLLLSQSIGDGYDVFGKPLKGQEQSLSYLRQALDLSPRHFAVNHFWIHAVEASVYLDSARHAAALLPTLAPGSPHIIHMPGHIYFRAGEYLRADSAFKKAFIADSIYMRRYNISSYNNWNYIHNLDFMVTNMTEIGSVKEGLYWQKKLDAIPPLESCRNSGKNANGYQHSFGHIFIPIRAHEWQQVREGSATLRRTFDSTGAISRHPIFAAMLTFYDLYAQFATLRDAQRYEEARAVAHEIHDFAAQSINKKAYRKDDYYYGITSTVADYLNDIHAFLKEMEGSTRKAEKVLDNAISRERWFWQSEPPVSYSSAFEWKIDFLIRQHRYDDAVKVADEYCAFRKNSPFSAYYKALASEKAGTNDAKEQYKKTLSLFGPDDLAIKREIGQKLK